MNFQKLQKQVTDNFDAISKHQLFTVGPIDRDMIWEKYLEGFAELGDRQHHTCNCCKSFLRQFANVVAIINGKVVSIWDGIKNDEYQDAINNLKCYIHGLDIENIFLVDTAICGTIKNYDKEAQIYWNHFSYKAPSKFVNKANPDTVRGEKRTTKEVFQRGLDELSLDSVETVLELISQGSLYRGKEHKNTLQEFLKLKKEYAKLSGKAKNLFVWSKFDSVNPAISRVRNTSIGTLLIDLSGGMELDAAVSRYESVVAPTNYKRPKAIVTAKMVEAAKQTLIDLDLIDALERRYAESRDLNVNDILYFHKPSAIKDVFDVVSKESVVNPRSLSKVETVSIGDFIEKIIPTSKDIEVLLENHHLSNMVSLVTSDCSKNLFKWNNPFSWYYTGGITDSIKERVKRAGGNIIGKLRASLSWSNHDDLDLHCITPNNFHIHFRNRRGGGGYLDVDENAGYGKTREPVENIIFTDTVLNGPYEVFVHNYSAREKRDVGFTVQIEFNGETFEFTHDSNNVSRHSIKFTIKNDVITFADGMESKPSIQEKWGIKTNTFHKVKAVTLSPNYWGENKVGNKHFLFFLDGAKNDESPRSIFNEFLRNDLDKHRKVFETIGAKLTVSDNEDQLSGVGFSETQRNHIYVRVKGKFTRTLKVTF